MPEIKNIKTAILIYKDPKYGDRRVVFGEPKEALDLLISNSPSIFNRLQKILTKTPKSKKKMLTVIKRTKDWFSKSHGIDAGMNMRLSLKYEIIKGGE